MSQSNFDSSGDGDGEDRGEITWNEFDWQQFLQRQQKEIARFLGIYNTRCLEPDHLDQTAQEMGWVVTNWNTCMADGSDDEPESPPVEDATEEEPYTLHRHPVFVASSGLHAQLRCLWEHLMARGLKAPAEPRAIWDYALALAESEREFLLAQQCIDISDFLLAVCHLKQVLRAINNALGQAEVLAELTRDAEGFLLHTRVRLFDLRDIALRLMQDCRSQDQIDRTADDEDAE